jgi:hypothetical protein
MKHTSLTILIHALVLILAAVVWQPAFSADEGKGEAARAYPGLYCFGPFGYGDRMEMERMRALRARREAIREARKREQQTSEQWQEGRGRWLDPGAEAMREQMEHQSQWLRQSNEAWWRWRNPRGAYIRDVMEAKQRYFEDLAKQREKAFERTAPWGAFPY